MAEKKLTRSEVKAWQQAWQRVKKRKISELRRMPLKKKIKQAELLFQLAQDLKLRHAIDDPEIVAVRNRWVRVKQKHENATRN